MREFLFLNEIGEKVGRKGEREKGRKEEDKEGYRGRKGERKKIRKDIEEER